MDTVGPSEKKDGAPKKRRSPENENAREVYARGVNNASHLEQGRRCMNSGVCPILAISIDRCGPVVVSECRGPDRLFWEVRWNCERWFFLDMREAFDWYRRLAAKFTANRKARLGLGTPAKEAT
jgi:hypothetical protein